MFRGVWQARSLPDGQSARDKRGGRLGEGNFYFATGRTVRASPGTGDNTERRHD